MKSGGENGFTKSGLRFPRFSNFTVWKPIEILGPTPCELKKYLSLKQHNAFIAEKLSQTLMVLCFSGHKYVLAKT